MISISFDQVESPELTRRRLTISDQSGAPLSQIDFDLLGAGPAQRPQNLDGFMGAVIQYAMFVRQPLAIKGRLSRQCLHNIAEFQSLIASYYPQMFRVIDVLPDDVDEGAPAKDAMRAISLFSGGVDSVFTLLRHQGKACPGGLSIKNVALIHHQYLEDPNSYVKKRLERFAPLLESLGVAITVQRTNLRQAMVKLGLKYVPTHGGQLSASLQQYAHCFEIGLFASGTPARAPVLPMDQLRRRICFFQPRGCRYFMTDQVMRGKRKSSSSPKILSRYARSMSVSSILTKTVGSVPSASARTSTFWLSALIGRSACRDLLI